MKQNLQKTMLAKALAWALVGLTSVTLIGCGSGDDRKENSFEHSHDHEHGHNGHQHDNEGHHQHEQTLNPEEKRYPYKGEFPLKAQTLTNVNPNISKLVSSSNLTSIIGLNNTQQPFVLFSGHNTLDGWTDNKNAVDIVAVNSNVYILDNKNQLTTFWEHGDHFHSEKPITIINEKQITELTFVVNPNEKLPYVFDKKTGALFKIDAKTRQASQLFDSASLELDFVPEKIVWLGAKVDEHTKQESLNYHPQSKPAFAQLEQGRWVITGKTNTGTQKIAIVEQNTQKKPIIMTVDYPITDIVASSGYRYAIMASDNHDDSKDKVTFLDSGLSLQSHGNHSDPNISQPKLINSVINKPNPQLNHVNNSSTKFAIGFLGNQQQSAGFVAFSDDMLSKNQLNYQAVHEKAVSNMAINTIGEQILVVLPNQLQRYEFKNNVYQKNQTEAINCVVPQALVSGKNHTLLGCQGVVYEIVNGYSANEIKALAFQEAGIKNTQLLERLAMTKSETPFDYNNPDVEAVKKYLQGIKEIQLYAFDKEGSLDLTKVKGIEYLTNVEKLTLETTQFDENVPDIGQSIVNAFPNLTHLNISHTNIKDLSFISQLKKLTNIEFESVHSSGQPLTNFEFLTQHPNRENIKSISAGGNQITDISFVKNLPNLKKLTMVGNKIQNINVLSELQHLEILLLSDNQLTALPDLSNNQNLKELNLSNNLELAEVDSLSKLTKLERLIINNASISQLPSLSANKNLVVIHAYNNSLTDASVFSNLPLLKTLFIHKNRIISLDKLTGLPALEELEVQSNRLTSLPDMSAFVKLQRLSASKNQIFSIGEMSHSLKFVNLSHNRLLNLSSFVDLPSLEYLNAEHNYIQTAPIFIKPPVSLRLNYNSFNNPLNQPNIRNN